MRHSFAHNAPMSFAAISLRYRDATAAAPSPRCSPRHQLRSFFYDAAVTPPRLSFHDVSATHARFLRLRRYGAVSSPDTLFRYVAHPTYLP